MPSFSSHPVLHPESWGVPLIRIGGVQLQASYGIVIAAVALSLFAITGSTIPGNADLPRVIGLGALFWISGWLVQSTAFLCCSRVIGSPASELRLGVIGVEMGPRRWPPRHAILVTLATLASLILLGSAYRLIEGGFQFPPIVRSDQVAWSAPSIGFGKYDSVWKSGAWLCWVQAVFQLYPLPRTLGRHMVSGLTSICSSSLELPRQVAVNRRFLVAISLLTMTIPITSVVRGPSFLGLHWMIFLGLSLMLWFSSHASDVGLALTGFRTAAIEEAASRHESRGSITPLEVGAVMRDTYHRWRLRRRLLTLQRRERDEAIDVQRLDEILTRLHQQGMQSLSPEDRRILDRVSDSLRRQRLQGNLDDPPST